MSEDHFYPRGDPNAQVSVRGLLYTLDGVKGVQSGGGTNRRDAVAQVAESVGGQLECFYFALGDRDAYVVVDLPDNESAAAVALTVNAAGGATVKTVVLLTPEEVDAAGKALGRLPATRGLTGAISRWQGGALLAGARGRGGLDQTIRLGPCVSPCLHARSDHVAQLAARLDELSGV